MIRCKDGWGEITTFYISDDLTRVTLSLQWRVFEQFNISIYLFNKIFSFLKPIANQPYSPVILPKFLSFAEHLVFIPSSHQSLIIFKI